MLPLASASFAIAGVAIAFIAWSSHALAAAAPAARVDTPRSATATTFAASTRALAAPRLYVLDCGTLIFNYPEEYNLTRAEVKNTNLSVACYLVVHPNGTLLFDTGLPDAVRGRPFNQTPFGGDPNAPSTEYFMLVQQTLKGQLTRLGYPPSRIDYLALSHYHGDHVGNANDYSGATWLVQQPEFDAMFGQSVPSSRVDPNARRLRNSRKQLLRGDHDVFGDGTVVLKSTPGHTPGHQSLYVRLAKTGGVVLSGDLYHYPEERTLQRMPTDELTSGTKASREALDAFMREVRAQLWVGHDITAFARQKKAPAYYD